MVSYGPSSQSYNFTHMTSFVDYRGDENMLCVEKGSICDLIYNRPEFSLFSHIAKKADMYGFLNDPQLNATLFIPPDDQLRHLGNDFFANMDTGLAKQIINASTLPGKLSKDVLSWSPVSYFNTRNPRMRAYITNIDGKMRINNCVDVVNFNIVCVNGIVHLVSDLIMPSQDTFMN